MTTTTAIMGADMTDRDRALQDLTSRIEELIYIDVNFADISESIVAAIRGAYSTPVGRQCAASAIAFDLAYMVCSNEVVDIPTRDVGFAG